MNGDPVSGKSLYWDYIKDQLLGKTAKLNPNFSEDITSDDRVYETWEGQEQETSKPLKVFFCNLDSFFLRKSDTRDVKGKLLRNFDRARLGLSNDLRELGDLIITSNRRLNEADINVTLKDTSGINYGQGISTEWHRTSTISVPSSLLLKMPKLEIALRAK